jgi:hypothetical protein
VDSEEFEHASRSLQANASADRDDNSELVGTPIIEANSAM